MDYLLRGKSNMKYIFSRILLFLMWACIRFSCRDDIDQKAGRRLIGSRGHQTQLISLWFFDHDGSKEG
jgi:hypothetical protein